MSICATARIIRPRLVVLAALVALAGCGKKDFDQSYSDKEKELSSQQAAMEQELDKRMTEKPGLESESSSETPAP